MLKLRLLLLLRYLLEVEGSDTFWSLEAYTRWADLMCPEVEIADDEVEVVVVVVERC